MRLRREILKSYYDHVPFVINSGYAHHAAFLARQAPTIRRRRTVAKTDSCGCPPLSGRPLQNRSQAINGNNIHRVQNIHGQRPCA